MASATLRTPPTLDEILGMERDTLILIVEDSIKTPKINTRGPDDRFMVARLVPTLGSKEKATYCVPEKSINQDKIDDFEVSLDLYDRLVRMRERKEDNLQVEMPDLDERCDVDAMPNIDDFFGLSDKEEKGSGYATGVDISQDAQQKFEEHFDGEAPLCAGCTKGEQYMRRAEEVHSLVLELMELKRHTFTEIMRMGVTDAIFLQIRGQHLNGMVEAIEEFTEEDVWYVRRGEYKHLLRSNKREGADGEGAAVGGAKRLKMQCGLAAHSF